MNHAAMNAVEFLFSYFSLLRETMWRKKVDHNQVSIILQKEQVTKS